jgi:hypothetical protein
VVKCVPRDWEVMGSNLAGLYITFLKWKTFVPCEADHIKLLES